MGHAEARGESAGIGRCRRRHQPAFVFGTVATRGMSARLHESAYLPDRAALSLRSGLADCYRMSLHALPTACEQRPWRGLDGIWTRCGTVCVTVLSLSCVMWLCVGVIGRLAADSTGPCARRARCRAPDYVYITTVLIRARRSQPQPGSRPSTVVSCVGSVGANIE